MPAFADELPDACPPPAATDAEGPFFAAHRVSPPDADDFRTAAERGAFAGRDECKRQGNSIMFAIEDARQLCLAYPGVYAYVSQGNLEAFHGKLLESPTKTSPSHHTLWRYAGVTMQQIFNHVV